MMTTKTLSVWMAAVGLGLALQAVAQEHPASPTHPVIQEVLAAPTRVGLGQASAEEPAKLAPLRLSDPLVQQKYLNSPDLLRFLRGTYSEACARGMLVDAATQVKLDLDHRYTDNQRNAARELLESKRIWKLSSLELEALFDRGYLNAANYCDCLVREISDHDLVNPRKGIEVTNKLPSLVQKTCTASAKELTARQADRRKQKAKQATTAVVP